MYLITVDFLTTSNCASIMYMQNYILYICYICVPTIYRYCFCYKNETI